MLTFKDLALGVAFECVQEQHNQYMKCYADGTSYNAVNLTTNRIVTIGLDEEVLILGWMKIVPNQSTKENK